ncbi:MAG: LysR family transcriptional regulator [Gammaproteobacteria bacterium]|nr:LysR family transcriptional regulator [Gammaproteobacteria bacterium]MDH5591809.1 LysR family transcriptional regulator [Gammaproteobacteria bacterium]
MHFTLQQLKLFEAVSRNSSYTRAAKELHLTQPAVSIQIKRLENQVGVPLFELVGKKVFPTAAGSSMYEASRDILARVEELKTSIETLQGEVKGLLKLSVVSTTKYFMPHLLGSFLAEHPDVEPKLTFTNRAKVIQRLYSNEVDFVVMGQILEDDKLETSPFLENILVPIAHPNHPLAKRKKIALTDLLQERFLEREIGSGTRMLFERMLAKQGLEVMPYMELGSSEAIKQGVMAGLGIAVISLHSIQLEQAANKLVILDVEGFPIKRPWYAVRLKGKKLSLVAKTFLDYILKENRTISQISNS